MRYPLRAFCAVFRLVHSDHDSDFPFIDEETSQGRSSLTGQLFRGITQADPRHAHCELAPSTSLSLSEACRRVWVGYPGLRCTCESDMAMLLSS